MRDKGIQEKELIQFVGQQEIPEDYFAADVVLVRVIRQQPLFDMPS